MIPPPCRTIACIGCGTTLTAPPAASDAATLGWCLACQPTPRGDGAWRCGEIEYIARGHYENGTRWWRYYLTADDQIVFQLVDNDAAVQVTLATDAALRAEWPLLSTRLYRVRVATETEEWRHGPPTRAVMSRHMTVDVLAPDPPTPAGAGLRRWHALSLWRPLTDPNDTRHPDPDETRCEQGRYGKRFNRDSTWLPG